MASIFSCQMTALQQYAAPKPWFPGEDNTLQIPVVQAVLTNAAGFELDKQGNLRFNGPDGSQVMFKTKFAFGALKPSQADVTAPLDQGPRAEIFAYVQVGDRKGVYVTVDETVYYPAYEWPTVRYTLDMEDIFEINEGDLVRCFAFYKWTVAPVTPVNPYNFYLNITNCDLSFLALSTDKSKPWKPADPSPFMVPKIEEVKMNQPYATVVELYKFKPGVTGTFIIDCRLNIKSLLCFDAKRQDTFPTVGVRWAGWLTVNGSADRKVQTLQTVTNQPNLIVGGTVWPSILEYYIMAELKASDEISVMAFIDDIFILVPPPQIFDIITQGSLPMTIQFTPRWRQALLPQVQTFPEYNDTLTLAIDGKMGEFPVEGKSVAFSQKKNSGANPYRFVIRDGQFIFQAKEPRWFRIRANVILKQFLLTNSNNDPAFVFSTYLGFAIGVNGAKQNELFEENFTYSDKMFLHKWMATQSAENAILLKPGDRVSFLFWATEVNYLNVPTNASKILPVFKAPEGSTIAMTAKLTIIVEDA